LFKFITHKSLLINILVGIFLSLLLVLLFFFMLGWITGHGEYEKVPAVTGSNINAARALLQSKGFTVEVVDSVYEKSQPKLSVIKQSPEPDATVKYGRTVYLTINRQVAPNVEMPNLVGLSFRSAVLYLQGMGLELGDTTYKPDIAQNAVLVQLYNGSEVKQGTKVPIGSSISFVLGSGIGNIEADVPDLVGLTYTEAQSILASMNINVGLPILLDANIKDTAKAFVSKQEPTVFTEVTPGQKVANKIRPGQVVDIWLTSTAPVKDSTNSKIDNSNANPY
jgi:beta-lactam-binding protein with PASTA domain